MRYQSAEAMAIDLRAILASLPDATKPVQARQTTRFIALPLQLLRPDPEIDFLSFSLPDAITASLSGLESLVVRSSGAARRYAAGDFDPRSIGREAGVDVVLRGTILRSGERVRVMTELVEAASGTVLWTKTAQVALGDLFELEDALVHQIAESLALPLSNHDRRRLVQEAPASPKAYELYLRANQITYSSQYTSPLIQARDVYRECVEEDPNFAPAWARLGRVYRVISKYGHGDPVENFRLAHEALQRALQLDPDLPVAHNYYTYLQVEEGNALSAMERLIGRGQTRVADPDLYAGLVVACRFCGLLEASVAAHHRARRLDSSIRTSVHFTYLAMGDHERAAAEDHEDPAYCKAIVPSLLGRDQESIASIAEMDRRGYQGVERIVFGSTLAALEGRREECVAFAEGIERLRFRDPEGLYFNARNLARVGETEASLMWLGRVIRGGFWCTRLIREDPWLQPLRARAEFADLMRWAVERQAEAAAVYARAGGERLLGVPARPEGTVQTR
jgi:TolB-like protein